jgi:hypothetical protein
MFMPKPVHLIFENFLLDQTVKTLSIHREGDILCYLGPRFNSTYSAWNILNVPFPYNHLNQQKIVLTDRFFIGMNPKL